MKVIAVNGSPRKGWNSDMVLDSAIEGARLLGAEVVKYNLFDIDFKGCRSCFSCKLKGSASFARCGFKDGLSVVIDDILSSDALIVSSPIYFGEVPGTVRSFYERLVFPCLLYSSVGELGYSKRIPTALIYTMGATSPEANGNLADRDKGLFEAFIGPTEILNVTNTYQFPDYSKYVGDFEVAEKEDQRKNVFPQDLKKAFELGRIISKAIPHNAARADAERK